MFSNREKVRPSYVIPNGYSKTTVNRNEFKLLRQSISITGCCYLIVFVLSVIISFGILRSQRTIIGSNVHLLLIGIIIPSLIIFFMNFYWSRNVFKVSKKFIFLIYGISIISESILIGMLLSYVTVLTNVVNLSYVSDGELLRAIFLSGSTFLISAGIFLLLALIGFFIKDQTAIKIGKIISVLFVIFLLLTIPLLIVAFTNFSGVSRIIFLISSIVATLLNIFIVIFEFWKIKKDEQYYQLLDPEHQFRFKYYVALSLLFSLLETLENLLIFIIYALN